MFRVNYSESGSNARQREESTYMMFAEYLEEIEQQSKLCHEPSASIIHASILYR